MMQDRYLFRGMRYDDKKWVTGHLYNYKRKDNGKEEYGILQDIETLANDFKINYVDPATVGQCTGLKDVYGNMVFEGDTVRLKRLSEEHEYKVFYNTEDAAFYFDEQDGCISPVANWVRFYTWEVVDNNTGASKEESE